jgi:CheY-like chemotaxis protein
MPEGFGNGGETPMKPVVLIAEGDDELRYSLARFFSGHGYEVATALSGLECLMQLYQRQPLAVVLDEKLAWGGSDGVLAVMREDVDLCHVPVILTLAAGCKRSSDHWGLPVVQVLGKPYSWNVLLDFVDAAVAKTEVSVN